jgi:hypothetical protein
LSFDNCGLSFGGKKGFLTKGDVVAATKTESNLVPVQATIVEMQTLGRAEFFPLFDEY